MSWNAPGDYKRVFSATLRGMRRAQLGKEYGLLDDIDKVNLRLTGKMVDDIIVLNPEDSASESQQAFVVMKTVRSDMKAKLQHFGFKSFPGRKWFKIGIQKDNLRKELATMVRSRIYGFIGVKNRYGKPARGEIQGKHDWRSY